MTNGCGNGPLFLYWQSYKHCSERVNGVEKGWGKHQGKSSICPCLPEYPSTVIKTGLLPCTRVPGRWEGTRPVVSTSIVFVTKTVMFENILTNWFGNSSIKK